MKKLPVALFTCLIFYACKKSNSTVQYTYPAVSYSLHNHLDNQVYEYAHSSIFHVGATIFDGWWSWDNDAYIRAQVTCVANKTGEFYYVELFDSAIVAFDPATGRDFRSVLSFSLPSINSFTNHNDTSVSINFRDTIYLGHAVVSVTITGRDSNNLATPSPTINGNFNMSGTVSNGFSVDSLSFSSSGTFTNMPYNQ